MIGRIKSEAGFALILTLVVTALMVAVVVEMIHQVYVDTAISRGFRDKQQASILAESGVMAVKMALSQNIDPALLLKALPKPIRDDVGSLDINISDESSKIDINFLVNGLGDYDAPTKETLSWLMSGLKPPISSPDNVLDSIAFWIDKSVPSRFGRADPYNYRNKKPVPYSARNDDMLSLTELSLVNGITPEMFNGLRDWLTVFSNKPNSVININSAPKPVLMALDKSITGAVADQIINMRPFQSTGDFRKVPELDSLFRNSARWGARLTTSTGSLRVTAVAQVKESARTVEAVISNGVVLSWQEY